MNKLNDAGLLFLRLSLGIMMAANHGCSKVMKLISGGEISFYNFLGLGSSLSLMLAAFAEFFSAILIALGIFTRFGSAALVITMFVAAFVIHAGDDFMVREKAFLYLSGFMVLFLTGAGKYSLQKLLNLSVRSQNKFVRFLFS